MCDAVIEIIKSKWVVLALCLNVQYNICVSLKGSVCDGCLLSKKKRKNKKNFVIFVRRFFFAIYYSSAMLNLWWNRNSVVYLKVCTIFVAKLEKIASSCQVDRYMISKGKKR